MEIKSLEKEFIGTKINNKIEMRDKLKSSLKEDVETGLTEIIGDDNEYDENEYMCVYDYNCLTKDYKSFWFERKK